MTTSSPFPTFAVPFDLPTCVGGAAILLILATWSFSRPIRKMPPGPRGLPILGNVFQLPQFQWLRFTEWMEQYGRHKENEIVFRFPLNRGFLQALFSR